MSDPRFGGQSTRTLQMFRGLCGEAGFKNVVILTTYWDQVSTGEGERREAQLKSNVFAQLVEGGAQFMRHDRTVESVRKVLRHFLPTPVISARIQTGIREEGKSVPDTITRSVQSKGAEEVQEEELAGLQKMLARSEGEKVDPVA